MNIAEITAPSPPEEFAFNEARTAAIQCRHMARQGEDLTRDTVREIPSTDGPSSHGDKVFFWSSEGHI